MILEHIIGKISGCAHWLFMLQEGMLLEPTQGYLRESVTSLSLLIKLQD